MTPHREVTFAEGIMTAAPRYPGIRVTANGNQLVSYHTATRIADAGVFYPITPSTELGELYQQSYAEGRLNVFGGSSLAVEAEGEHAARGGPIARWVCGKRVVNFTSGQGLLYGVEQYYHAPGKCSTMVVLEDPSGRSVTADTLLRQEEDDEEEDEEEDEGNGKEDDDDDDKDGDGYSE